MSGSRQVTDDKLRNMPDVFQDFVMECRKELEPMLSSFGLVGPEVLMKIPDCAVRYSNANIRITFHYEYGGRPWATLEVAMPRSWKQVPLDRLVRTMAPDLTNRLKRYNRTSVAKEHLRVVGIYAGFIRDHLSSIFNGDFSPLAATQQKAAR